MKDKIEALDTFIKATGIITNWGGWCINNSPEPGKDFPYGLKPITDKNPSNIFSYDDNHLCSGYMFISNVANRDAGSAKNAIKVTVRIHIFTNIKKNEEIITTYDRPLGLFGQLAKNYKILRFSTPINNRFQEFAAIEIDFDTFADCNFTKTPEDIC